MEAGRKRASFLIHIIPSATSIGIPPAGVFVLKPRPLSGGAAAQHEAIRVSAGAFDSDRMLLNCANGLVDLRTGELLERGPEHLVSKLVDVDYDPTAKCPTFDRFIDDIFCGDRDLIR